MIQKINDGTCFVQACGEIQQGLGEDAYLCVSSLKCDIIAVFDGCGGLGSRKYPSEGGHTGAYLAARRARDVLAACTEVCDELNRDPLTAIPELYGECLVQTFLKYNSELNSKNGENRHKSDMQKSLPTTVCAAVIGDDTMNCFWAGDSRIYLLDISGFHIISGGSGVLSDFDETFPSDKRLINYANADIPFNIYTKKISDLPASCAVIAVTDGVYAYFRTAMEFEYALLQTLIKADSPQDWGYSLKNIIGEYASDDFSFAALLRTPGGFSCFRENMKIRYDYIYNNYIKILEDESEDNTDNTAERLWQNYRGDYLSLCQS